jgi:homopolymeric O-antigen transport system ATP-binding protein
MSLLAIRVENISKQFHIGQPELQHRTFREAMTDVFSAPLRRLKTLRGKENPQASFWALRNVNFEVQPGEIVGIVGRNGAGKSTLLKVLSRITAPTTGRIEMRGRIASLLEVGTGFHPELTGRENIYLNGGILGMSRSEIGRKFDEIVAFSEVEKFIDTPVKRYSSGMYLRLAFAVAAHLEPEILVIDEVLAVGDSLFQTKCIGKMGEVAKNGRTVLFVSHNMAAVSQLCERALLLSEGSVAFEGDCASVIERYLTRDIVSDSSGIFDVENAVNRSGTGEARISRVEVRDNNSRRTTAIGIGEPFWLCLHVEMRESLHRMIFGVEIRSVSGAPLANLRSDSQSLSFGPFAKGTTALLKVRVPGLPFYPGVYTLDPWIAPWEGKKSDQISGIVSVTLESKGLYHSESYMQEGRGFVLIDCEWTSAAEVTQ